MRISDARGNLADGAFALKHIVSDSHSLVMQIVRGGHAEDIFETLPELRSVDAVFLGEILEPRRIAQVLVDTGTDEVDDLSVASREIRILRNRMWERCEGEAQELIGGGTHEGVARLA